MNKKIKENTRLFFDCEFTGLHKDTTLISIGLVSNCGRKFYAELNDFDKFQIDEWLQENIINNLTLQNTRAGITRYNENTKLTEFFGNSEDLKTALTKWLKEFNSGIEIISDCLAYDWVLFNNIFGGAFDIPDFIYYIPFDICTMFYCLNIDPDVNREEYAFNGKIPKYEKKHNALWDAEIIKKCFDRFCIDAKKLKTQ